MHKPHKLNDSQIPEIVDFFMIAVVVGFYYCSLITANSSSETFVVLYLNVVCL